MEIMQISDWMSDFYLQLSMGGVVYYMQVLVLSSVRICTKAI